MQWIYLDNNATTRPSPKVAAAMQEVNDQLWANPSSVHRFGQTVRQRLELARAAVSALINVRPREIVFTSGGTESNNLAIRGTLGAALAATGDDLPPPVLITTPVEHSAVREPAEDLERAGGIVERLDVDDQGRIAIDDATERIGRHMGGQVGVVLVSVQWANNETGVIQPIADLAAAVAAAREAARQADSRAKIYLHVDATQAVGKIDVDARAAGVDLLTLAGHKFHGPKGAGALYVRTGVRLHAQQRGGPQERERRGGTENTAGIIGLGVAAEEAVAFLEDAQRLAALAALRNHFEQGVLAQVAGSLVNGGSPATPRLWNTSNVAFPGLEAEAILLGLSERGVCASAGAACSSGSLEPSPVLRAMHVPEPVAHGSVRFSLSRDTTAEEIEQALAIVPQVVARLGRTMPV